MRCASRLAGLLSSVILVVAVSAPAAGQPPDVPAFPQVSGGGPPDWVHAGTRLSWYGAAASVRTSPYTYVEDPEGDWEDPVTGKRYRRTEEDEMPTAAGQAWSQTTVVAVAGDDVVLDTSMWAIDLESGQLTLTPLWGGRYAGAAVEGAWVRPDLLANVASGGTRDLQVLRGTYTLGSTPLDAVSFLDRTEGDYASTVFDAASGVLVATTARVKAAGSPVRGPLDVPEGNVQIAWTRFAGARDVGLPGRGAPNPAWVAPGVELRYEGTATLVNPFDPSGFQVSYPVDALVTLDEVGDGWATFASETSTELNGYVERSSARGATGSTGLYWYDPTALAAMGAGDVLDEDPVTGARTTVAGGAAAGTVTLATTAPGVSVRATYDTTSGALTGLTVAQGLVATVTLELASVG